MASRISISPGVLRRVTLVGEGASAMGYLFKERGVCSWGNMGIARNIYDAGIAQGGVR